MEVSLKQTTFWDKENLYNFKNGEATLHILSDHNGTKLKIYGKQIPTNTEIH